MYSEDIKLPTRSEINAKYFVTYNKYKQSQLGKNNLIAEYRKYRSKMALLIKDLDNILLKSKLKENELTMDQSKCNVEITTNFANSTRDDRYEAMMKNIELMSVFISSGKALESLSVKEVKLLRIIASYMFGRISECLNEINAK